MRGKFGHPSTSQQAEKRFSSTPGTYLLCSPHDHHHRPNAKQSTYFKTPCLPRIDTGGPARGREQHTKHRSNASGKCGKIQACCALLLQLPKMQNLRSQTDSPKISYNRSQCGSQTTVFFPRDAGISPGGGKSTACTSLISG